MVRKVLSDDIWQQIQETMKFYGYYRSKNSRDIMEAISRYTEKIKQQER